MRYLKVILTIIAILLTLHLIKPFLISTAVASKWQDVNIVAIGGKHIAMPETNYFKVDVGASLPVRVMK